MNHRLIHSLAPSAAAALLLAALLVVSLPLPVDGNTVLVSSGSRDRRVIAITIDDCVSRSAVLADLAILEREHVNATWFPIGRFVAGNADIWRRVAAAGFPIANHTFSHTNLTHYSRAWVTADILRAAAVIKQVTGRAAAPFLRPPGGAWNMTVLGAAADAGIRVVALWDVSTADTGRMPYRANVKLLVRNAIRGKDGTILLMHANLPYTQQALPQIIASYRARGFDFVTLGQMFGIKGPVPFPPGSAPPAPPAPPAKQPPRQVVPADRLAVIARRPVAIRRARVG